jgi:hypothetical protein
MSRKSPYSRLARAAWSINPTLGELAARRQVGILDDIGGIDAALEPSVHAQPDHAFEPVTVALDQDSQGALVAVAGGVQQFVVASGIDAHERVHIPLHGNAGRTFTALERILSWLPKTFTPNGAAAAGGIRRSPCLVLIPWTEPSMVWRLRYRLARMAGRDSFPGLLLFWTISERPCS